MARNTRTVVVLSCDFCGGDTDDVANRRFQVNGKQRQMEACESCWASAIADLLGASRQVRGRKPKRTT